MDETQKSLEPQFDAAARREDQLKKLRDEQYFELVKAMEAVGWWPSRVAWKLCVLVHKMARDDGILRRGLKWIASDGEVSKSKGRIAIARELAIATGILQIVEIKSIRGGSPLKALRIDRVRTRAIATQKQGPTQGIDRGPTQGIDRGPTQGPTQGIDRGPTQGIDRTAPIKPPTSILHTPTTTTNEAVAAVFIDVGLSPIESKRIASRRDVAIGWALDVCATYRHNLAKGRLRGPGAIVSYFDRGAWPSDDIEVISHDELEEQAELARSKLLNEKRQKIEDDVRWKHRGHGLSDLEINKRVDEILFKPQGIQ